jgi:hypothetical protein
LFFSDIFQQFKGFPQRLVYLLPKQLIIGIGMHLPFEVHTFFGKRAPLTPTVAVIIDAGDQT